MVQSMTGYGKAASLINDRQINVELRALNGKTTDLRIKFPTKYASRELDIRSMVLGRLQRGRFDMTISLDGDTSDEYVLDEKLFKNYYNKLKSLADELGVRDQDFFNGIIRIPNVVHTTMEDLTEEEWMVCSQLIGEVIDSLTQYRLSEGMALYRDITVHLQSILDHLEKVSLYEKARIDAIKQKISANLNGLLEDQKIDENRFEQELIYYLERLDINEEKIRLKQNCEYFREILDDKNLVEKGKKLTFISQEIGREINTMGAKAQFAPIQQLVVSMKDDLERIKEQVLNVL